MRKTTPWRIALPCFIVGALIAPALWVWISPCLGGAILGFSLAIIKANEVEVPDKNGK